MTLLGKLLYKARLHLSRLVAAIYSRLARLLGARVYDCFLFFDERELLLMRLEELDSVVDTFVICESLLTWTGQQRHEFCAPSVIASLPERLQSKIRYIPLYGSEYSRLGLHPTLQTEDFWKIENFTRDQLVRGLYDLRPWDFVWLSDLDEIPNPKKVFQPGIMKMLMSYYKFNLVDLRNPWFLAKAVLGVEFLFATPSQIRRGEMCLRSYVPDSGWHFSYLMTSQQILQKLKRLCEQNEIFPEMVSEDYISECIATGRDIFQRFGVSFEFLPVDGRFPRTLQENPSRYKVWLASDPMK